MSKNIEIKNLKKSFGEKIIFDDFSAVFEYGKITALMSPSGSGKTTLLRILSGLDKDFSGEICGIKSVSYCPQGLSLLPWYSAEKNVTLFAGKDEETKKRIKSAFAAFSLSGEENKKPRTLSGGMCQRVAIIRAFLSSGELLILDEPFKGIDNETKLSVISYLKENKNPSRTVIFTTHSEEEAKLFADKIVRF